MIDSLRARSVARFADGPAIRERFRKAAKSFLAHAPGLPFRALLWVGLSGWASYALLAGKEFPLSPDHALTAFVGGIGLLYADTSPNTQGFAGDGTGFAGRAGVGADYYLRPDIVLNLEFSAVLPTSPVEDIRILPLVFGAQYRF